MNAKIQKIVAELGDVEQWIANTQLNETYSAAYWNDANKEKDKDLFWIVDGNYGKCLDYLESSGLMKECKVALNYIQSIPKDGLKIADLACGIGWTSALISKECKVSEVAAIEFSRHRLDTLFPYSIDMLEGEPEKIQRYMGSFYEIKLKSNDFDVVFMSQAFHHADRPLALLLEIDRILRPGGVVIFVGENYIGIKRWVKALAKMVLKKRRVSSNFFDVFPPDHDSGDHYYRVSDYYLFFQLLGYGVNHVVVNGTSLVVRAIKS